MQGCLTGSQTEALPLERYRLIKVGASQCACAVQGCLTGFQMEASERYRLIRVGASQCACAVKGCLTGSNGSTAPEGCRLIRVGASQCACAVQGCLTGFHTEALPPPPERYPPHKGETTRKRFLHSRKPTKSFYSFKSDENKSTSSKMHFHTKKGKPHARRNVFRTQSEESHTKIASEGAMHFNTSPPHG